MHVKCQRIKYWAVSPRVAHVSDSGAADREVRVAITVWVVNVEGV